MDFWGGGEKLHLEYAIEFQKKGYNVVIFAYPNSPLEKKAKQNNISVNPISLRKLSFLNPLTIQKIIKSYKKHNIDTVIFSNSQDVKAGGIAAKKADLKRIVYLRGLAVPIKNNAINRRLFNQIFTHVVANSQATKKAILTHLEKVINPELISVIYHGIEVEPDTTKQNKVISNSSNQDIILGTAGRLTEQKGQLALVKIAQILRDKKVPFTIYIAGTGELESIMKTEITKAGLEDKIILLGFVEDMNSFMNSIDLFLLPSLWEGFGYVIVEAMIKSKPVIAFDLSSNPEIIDEGNTGYIVEYPNYSLFAEKIEALSTNKPLRNEMGSAAYRRVIERFNLVDRIDEFEKHILQ